MLLVESFLGLFPADITWYANNSEIISGGRYTTTSDNQTVQLTITDALYAEDNTQFRVRLNNTMGEVECYMNVTVQG